MNWQDMDSLPDLWDIEGTPILVLRPANDVSKFVIEQVSAFEGNFYPDALDGCVDYDDKVTDAVKWCKIDTSLCETLVRNG